MTYLMLVIWTLFTRPMWVWRKLLFSDYNPLSAPRFRARRLGLYQQYEVSLAELLQRAGPASNEQVDRILNESKQVRVVEDPGESIVPAAWDGTRELAQLCYALVRLKKPATVVETGVGRGVTSCYILRAMEENGVGHLYSIDLPMYARRARESLGILVPDSLKSRWTLIFGPGDLETKRLLRRLGTIDVFIHDSKHTYLSQRAEYRTALQGLSDGGVLVSDDVGNDALLEVSELLGGELMVTKQPKPGYIGINVKRLLSEPAQGSLRSGESPPR